MMNLLLPLLLVPAAVSAERTIESGTLLTYRGELVAVKGDEVDTRKTFQLTVLVADADEGGASLYWTVSENGRGSWPWPEHFGRMDVDDLWREGGATGPSLLYDLGDGTGVAPLIAPMLATDGPLAPDRAWQRGGLDYEVRESGRAAGRDVWRVDVRNRFGRKRTVHVDRKSPLIVAINEVVFMGPGREHLLTSELVASQKVSAEQLEKTTVAFTAMLSLRDRLRRKARQRDAIWTNDQLAMLKSELPATAALAEGGPLAPIAQSAQKDLKLQHERSGALAALRGKFVGSPPAKFKLNAAGGESFSEKDLNESVTIVHFWEYSDTPLEEPYGQIGYLDFLYRQRKRAGVKVYGVAVDRRLENPFTRRAAARSVKKLRSFMNLSYPVLLDDGTVIKQFGDPRSVGARLPLFVLVGPDGKIVQYHVGYYKVHPDRGLTDLDAEVVKALNKRG